MEVVCAILHQKNKVLLAQRPKSKAHSELWEFPGGKVKVEESYTEALSRELFEELNVKISSFNYIGAIQTNKIHLHTYIAPLKESYSPLEHRSVAWTKLHRAEKFPLCPSDLETINLYSKKIEEFLTL